MKAKNPLDIFKTRDERMLAKFFDQMFVATGKKEYTMMEIFKGIETYGISVTDWKQTLDEFVLKGFVVKTGNTIRLGEAFDFLTQKALKERQLMAGLTAVRDICRAHLGEAISLTKSLPEQVEMLEEALRGCKS